MNESNQPTKKSSLISHMLIAVISSFCTAVVMYLLFTQHSGIISPLGKTIAQVIPEDKPLEKYTFANLANTPIQPSQIIAESVLGDFPDYTAHLFTIQVEGQKVTGQFNIPKSTPPTEGFPVILMNRGFIEPAVYQTGMGTKNASAYLASRGFVTIAPDYLGFGGSDQEDVDPMAARVKKPMTPLTILFSLGSLNQITSVDMTKIGMWGHSNGGQISLSVLEIIGQSPYWTQPIPTTLWAPVTSAFPYNILFYTDDFDTVGKSLRRVLFNFELKYDTDQFSIHPYLDWIDSPIQLHQGTADDLIPTSWSDRVAKLLQEKQKDITYFKYEGSDHNLQPAWGTVIARDLEFFQKHFE